MHRPTFVWALVLLLGFLGLGGIYGGVSMLIDPTGKILQMDGVLPRLPVANYTLPGLFLILVMGVFPFLLIGGLIRKTKGAWTGTIVLGIILILWLGVQAMLIGFQWAIQYVTLVNGLLIVLVALIPSVRRFYS